MIVGNKSDLYKDRKISLEKGIEKAQSLNLHLFETSALDKTNVTEAFYCLFKEIYLDMKNKSRGKTNNSDGGNLGKGAIELNTGNKPKKKKCC